MAVYEREYKKLNEAQTEAVNTLDGPVLVIAGPGTGKTQLLSMRVAHLLRQPDVVPANILCITFTDNAARNMRERLESIIGQAAYHVSINTFHSFGSDIINQYLDFFSGRELLQPIDELGSYEILRSLFAELPHSNLLSTKIGDEYVYLKDTLSVISWLKQNALAPEELLEILQQNEVFIRAFQPTIAEVFKDSPSVKFLPSYKHLLDTMSAHIQVSKYSFADYGSVCSSELRRAIESTDTSKRYVPLITAWRNSWCEKGSDGLYRFKDSGKNLKKLRAVARIYKHLQVEMANRGLYDFDDMIVEVVHALETHDELKFNLQERYQYILIDEFQDTNKAQMRIIKALGDNPVNEGRPNIMAVGDDDQAIYAFQGAQSSNMVDFVKSYRDVKLITLADNYRSTQTILDASRELVRQADNRLEDELALINKRLFARAPRMTDTVEHTVLPSELQQYQWIAEKIKNYIRAGIAPQEIAVIAPKHKFLERLMPYIGAQKIPVAYERKENILDAPMIRQLITMSELVDALSRNDHANADALMSEVLTYPFWNVALEDVARLSIECYETGTHWIECMLSSKLPHIQSIASWFLTSARESHVQPIEYILDRLIGNTELVIDSNENGEPIPTHLVNNHAFHSPMRAFYFSDKNLHTHTDEYLALLGQLSTLRHRLRAWQPDKMLRNKDFVEFVRLHREAKIKIIDTNPHTQTTNAVQVMTAYKAKGLEFEVVFIINAQDEVWGTSARSRSDRIRLPKNMPIKPAGQSLNDRIRLFYVALTRSKHTLHITSYSSNLDNKKSLGLSFIGGNSATTEPVHHTFQPTHLSAATAVEAVEILSTDWAYRFRDILADKPTLFEPLLKKYKLSVTHLNNFLDVVNAGPHYFLVHNLLRFPEAMTPHAAYGDAVHKTLQWMYGELRTKGLPDYQAVDNYFCSILERKHLPPQDFKLFSERGKESLRLFIQARKSTLCKDAIIERGFGNEGAIVGTAHLTGKVDMIEIEQPGQISVTDFKTGSPAKSWKGKYDYEQLKLHKYKQQLMFYKLLIERSATYAQKYIVNQGALEFIEADENGAIVPPLKAHFSQNELARFEQLIRSVWQHIQSLNFPDTSKYSRDFRGVQAFEQDLIDGIV
jgi:DNA helicase-2/ATP-dependent DNA helicase PcrA